MRTTGQSDWVVSRHDPPPGPGSHWSEWQVRPVGQPMESASALRPPGRQLAARQPALRIRVVSRDGGCGGDPRAWLLRLRAAGADSGPWRRLCGTRLPRGFPAVRLGLRGCGPEAAGGSLHFQPDPEPTCWSTVSEELPCPAPLQPSLAGPWEVTEVPPCPSSAGPVG